MSMSIVEKPSSENSFLYAHAQLLASSYAHLTGKPLFNVEYAPADVPRALFEAPFGLVSHNTDPVPIFNYGNQAALAAFELSWSKFIQLASRDSAETVVQADREVLMDKARQDGFIDNYRGIRISSSGRRFWIERATIWNVVDGAGTYRGQAAMFYLGK